MRQSIIYALEHTEHNMYLLSNLERTGANLHKLGESPAKFELFVEIFGGNNLSAWTMQEWAAAELAWDILDERKFFDIYTMADRDAFLARLQEQLKEPAKGLIDMASLRYDPTYDNKVYRHSGWYLLNELGIEYGIAVNPMVPIEATNKMNEFMGANKDLFKNKTFSDYDSSFAYTLTSFVSRIMRTYPFMSNQFSNMVRLLNVQDFAWDMRINFNTKAHPKFDHEDMQIYDAIVSLVRKELEHTIDSKGLQPLKDSAGLVWRW